MFKTLWILAFIGAVAYVWFRHGHHGTPPSQHIVARHDLGVVSEVQPLPAATHNPGDLPRFLIKTERADITVTGVVDVKPGVVCTLLDMADHQRYAEIEGKQLYVGQWRDYEKNPWDNAAASVEFELKPDKP
jgi:hypothetical protein